MDLPSSESLIFEKIDRIADKKKAVSAIQVQTMLKMEHYSFNRVLEDVDFLKWKDPSSFKVRVNREHFDKVISHLGDLVCLVFTQDYIVLSTIDEKFWFGYMIGYSTLESEVVSTDEETADTDELIAEVKSKKSTEEE
jgi:hypothetical protein